MTEKEGYMWNAEIKNGTLHLNNDEVPCLQNFTLNNEAGGIAVLTLSMVVEVKDEILLQQGQHWKLSVQAE